MTHGRKLGYGYDLNGNQTTRTVPNGPDRTWSQTWDYENRLIKAEKIKGTEKRTATFTYDPFNRRIGKQLTTIIDGVTKTYTWSYVYDSSSIALEVYTDNTGAVTKTWYTEGPSIDEHLALERNGSYYYYHANELGSIVAITDSAKNTVQSYTYDSYGLPKLTTSFVNSYAFTGREWDPQAGLYYYRARYYDPMDGMFVNKDPIGFRGGINLYAYVHNNPVNKKDPSGKDDSDIWAFPGEYYSSRGDDLDAAWRDALNGVAKEGAKTSCEVVCHGALGKGIGKALKWVGLESKIGEGLLTSLSCKKICTKATDCISNYADQLERERQQRKRDEYFNNY